jgi:hypothetical protein
MSLLAGKQMPVIQFSNFTKFTVWDLKDKIGTRLGSGGNSVRKCDERRGLLLLLLLLFIIIIIIIIIIAISIRGLLWMLKARQIVRKFTGRLTLF